MAHPLYAKHGRFNEYGLNKLIGVEVNKFEDGYSQAVIKVTESVLGLPIGSAHTGVHGGAIATLVDVGMSAALVSLMKDDELARTVQLQINYLAAVQSGVLICESKVIQKGRRIATVESEVRNEGSLVAKTTGTYYISKAKGD
jgi:acyl-CoA thioesterase